MDLEFVCRKCGGEVEADLADLAEEPNVVCPDCGEEADPTPVADVAGAVEELLATAKRLRGFHLRIELDSAQDSPEVYDADDVEDDEDEDDEDLEDEY
jgi:peptide subunit release factor 1 (eRF1)